MVKIIRAAHRIRGRVGDHAHRVIAARADVRLRAVVKGYRVDFARRVRIKAPCVPQAQHALPQCRRAHTRIHDLGKLRAARFRQCRQPLVDGRRQRIGKPVRLGDCRRKLRFQLGQVANVGEQHPVCVVGRRIARCGRFADVDVGFAVWLRDVFKHGIFASVVVCARKGQQHIAQRQVLI